jgi:hypothetical protein
MKKTLLALGLLLMALIAAPVSRAQNTTTLKGSGAPAGSCSFVLFYIDTSTGNFWDCPSGTWTQAGSGGVPGLTSKVFVTGSAYTNATTTFSNVTGLSFSVAATTNYVINCQIVWQGSASTAGVKFQWTGPASPTAVAASSTFGITATTTGNAAATAFSSAMANTGTITATTNFAAEVSLGLVNGANAGTVQLQAASNGTGTVTIQPGSSCTLQ